MFQAEFAKLPTLDQSTVLDPNPGQGLPKWPQYTAGDRQWFNFTSAETPGAVENYRDEYCAAFDAIGYNIWQ